MPGLLIDAMPFSAPRDLDLEALVATLEAALAPDAVELLFRVPDQFGKPSKAAIHDIAEILRRGMLRHGPDAGS